jgi:DeoR family glycerol-3-phosphate regulon repressor
MKRSHERHALIMSLVTANGFVAIEDMAAACETSTQTIRRDLAILSNEGKILRYHGGARLPDQKRSATYEIRSASHVDEKLAAASLLPDLIPDGSSLFLAGGSTLALAAQCLLRKERLTIVTNNLHAAVTFYDKDGFDVHVVGGWLRTASGSLVGDGALASIESFSLDFAVIGTCGINDDGTLLEYDQSLVGPVAAMIANAREKILIADSSKLNANGIVRGVHLREIDHLLIEKSLPNGALAGLTRHGVTVHAPTDDNERSKKGRGIN